MTRLGYQVPNFTYPGVGSDGLFEAVAAQAVEAEESGFDTVLVMDHFYQLPMLGAPDNAMIECYTLLAALSQRTSRSSTLLSRRSPSSRRVPEGSSSAHRTRCARSTNASWPAASTA